MGDRIKVAHIISLLIWAIVIYLVYRGITYEAKVVATAFQNDLECGTSPCDLHLYNFPIIALPSGPLSEKDVTFSPENQMWHIGLVNFLASVIVYAIANQPYTAISGMEILGTIDGAGERLLGVLARNYDDPNTLYIAFRGTQSLSDFGQDLSITQDPFFDDKILVHRGFLNVYFEVQPKIKAILENFPKFGKIVVCGHSLGAAVATILAFTLSKVQAAGQTILVTYASPRVGNVAFANACDETMIHLRLSNDADIVPTIPPPVSPNQRNASLPVFYQHTGTEARFNTNWKSILNNHFISNYMHAIENGLVRVTTAPQ